MYNDTIKEIIQRQQEYEFLKHISAVDTLFFKDENKKQDVLQDEFLQNTILPQIEKSYQKKKFKESCKKIDKAIFIIAIAFLAFVCILAAII